MARLKIGAVVEFETTKGLAYAIYSHWHEEYGYLIRVFEGFFDQRPNPISDLLLKRIQFSTFTTLAVALKMGRVRIVGYLELPEVLRQFPLFRTSIYDSATDRNGPWWLWDGLKDQFVGDLTPEQWKYPIKEICTDTLVIEKLEKGWVQEGARF